MAPRTLSEKVWDAHVVHSARGRARPLVHRPAPRPRGHLTAGLRRAAAGGPHGAPARTDGRHGGPQRADQGHRQAGRRRDLGEAARRCSTPTPPSSASRCYPMGNPNQGIVHVIGPEQGWTPAGHDDRLRRQPHLDARRLRRARLRDRHERGRARAGHADAPAGAAEDDGGRRSRATLAPGVTAKDVALAVIGTIGTGGGIGHVIEYRGSAIRGLSMEGRMTLCNMSIEGGARAGLVAPDETTFEYVKGRDRAPTGAALGRGGGLLAHAADRRRRDLRQGGLHRRRR